VRTETGIINTMTTAAETVTLWRPTGPEELALVEASGWREWPPRLPGQPIFYPVLSEEYATMIARDWNVRHSGSGYVTRFQVRRSFPRPVRGSPGRRTGDPGVLDPRRGSRRLEHQHRRHYRSGLGVPLTARCPRQKRASNLLSGPIDVPAIQGETHSVERCWGDL
jgi:hypothetical protein